MESDENAAFIEYSTVQAILLIGIQGSGKSTFYEHHFASTHLRISRDIAGTPAREQRLLESCIARQLDFVVDNTNATIATRKPIIETAKAAGYRVIGYNFIVDIAECLARNAQRSGKARCRRLAFTARENSFRRLNRPKVSTNFMKFGSAEES